MLTVAAQAVFAAYNLALLPLVIHFSGVDATGLWMLLLAWTQLLALFDFGLTDSLSRQIAYSQGLRSRSSPEQTETSFVALSGDKTVGDLLVSAKAVFLRGALLVLPAGVVIGLCIPHGALANPQFAVVWLLLVASTSLALLGRFYGAVLVGMLLAYKERLFLLCSLCVQAILTVGLLFLGAGLTGLAAASLAGACANLFLLHRSVARIEDVARSHASKSLVRELLSFSRPQFVVNLSGFAMRGVQPIILGFLMAPSDVVAYGAMFRPAALFLVLLQGIFQPQTAFVIDADASGNVRRHVRQFRLLSITVLALATIGFAGWWLAGPFVIRIWTLETVTASAAALAWICLSHWLISLDNFTAVYLLAKGRNPFAWASVAGGIINLSLCFALIPPFGLAGAAFAGLLGHALTTTAWSFHRFARRVKEEPHLFGLSSSNHVQS